MYAVICLFCLLLVPSDCVIFPIILIHDTLCSVHKLLDSCDYMFYLNPSHHSTRSHLHISPYFRTKGKKYLLSLLSVYERNLNVNESLWSCIILKFWFEYWQVLLMKPAYTILDQLSVIRSMPGSISQYLNICR